MGGIWLEPQLSKGMGWGPASPPPTRESERLGAAPRRRAPGDPWVPAWAPTGRAHGRPARNWGEEGGRRGGRREGGDRTCLISPQAPRGPHPRGTGGGREEGGRARRPDAGVSPASRGGTGTMGSRLSACSCGVPPTPLRDAQLLPPRVAPTRDFRAPTLWIAPPRRSPCGWTPHSARSTGLAAPSSTVSLSLTPSPARLSHACAPRSGALLPTTPSSRFPGARFLGGLSPRASICEPLWAPHRAPPGPPGVPALLPLVSPSLGPFLPGCLTSSPLPQPRVPCTLCKRAHSIFLSLQRACRGCVEVGLHTEGTGEFVLTWLFCPWIFPSRDP